MNYNWRCQGCDLVVEITRPVAECTVPPGEEFSCLCPENLPPDWVRKYEAAMFMKASYPDGYKRKGWGDLKESAKLEKLAATSKSDTKREIKAEIQKMGIKPGKDSL